LSAGLKAGFSKLIIGVIYTLFKNGSAHAQLTLMMPFVYPMGNIFVIIGRSELLIEHITLAALTAINSEAILGSLAKIWLFLCFGNIAREHILDELY